MLERRRARITWALGLIIILCSYNLAYANVKIGENTDAPSTKVRIAKSNDDGASKPLATGTTTTTVPLNKKNVSTAKTSTGGARSCACSCSSRVGRAAVAPSRWWDCMKGCLRSWGVSPIQLALCAATCAYGLIPICAICLALDASVFMLCASGCAVYSTSIITSDEGHEPILVRKLPRNNKKKTGDRVLAFAAH